METGGSACGLDGPGGRFAEAPLDGVGAVHDLGNLIQIAASAINLVGRSRALAGEPTLEPVLASAKTALKQAGDLVRQTLGRTREASIVVRKVPDLLDVGDCLAEVLALVKWVCEPDVRLAVDAPSGLPRVRCSDVDLQNAILNLAINARDAMPEGGVLSLSVYETALCEVEISVADDGAGMAPDTLQAALNPYFTTKFGGRGAGLGLAMVRRFADELGGGLEIASQPGHGTTVILRLPTA